MLAIFKGGNTTHGYEREAYFRYMGKTGNVGDSVKKVKEEAKSVLHS